MKLVFLILTFTFGTIAHAGWWITEIVPIPSHDCDVANSVNATDPPKLNANNQRILALNIIVAKDTDSLNRELYPQYNIWMHSVGIYDLKGKAAQEGLVAVNEAIVFMKNALITESAVRHALDHLANKFPISQNQSLGDQIRKLANTDQVSPKIKVMLEQLANAVTLIENTQPDWQQLEADIVGKDLKGQTPLSTRMIESLRSLSELLSSDIQQISDSEMHDNEKANSLFNAIFKTQTEISNSLEEINDRQKENQALRDELNRWKVKDHCHTRPIHYME